MAEKTGIQWTDKTWNPLTGCTIVSAGCSNCYAMLQAHRLEHKLNQAKYAGTTKMVGDSAVWTGKINLWPKALAQPLRWGEPSMIFVNSMSDLFHEDVPRSYVAACYGIMLVANHHIFQILTKREKRMLEIVNTLTVEECIQEASRYMPDEDLRLWARRLSAKGSMELPAWHIWNGMTMEDQPNWNLRMACLRDVHSYVRWVSMEPQIGFIDPDLDSLPAEVVANLWLVVGGESSQNKPARPFRYEWAEYVLNHAKRRGVPVFIKQKGNQAYDLDGEAVFFSHHHGGDPAEWPEWCRVREWPRYLQEEVVPA